MEWAGTLGALARIGAALSIAPPFASFALPRRVRAMLAVALTLAMSQHLPVATASAGVELGFAIGGEILVGLAIGMSMALVFSAATWAGDLVAGQLGLNLSEAYDPGGATDGTPLGQAWRLLAVILFLAANGHHVLIRGLLGSFDALPALQAASAPAAGETFIALLDSATSLAVRLAAPVFVATLIADVVIALAGRTIPQLGALTAGVTVRSVAGLCVLIAGVSVTVAVLQGGTLGWVRTVNEAIGSLGR